MCTRFVYNGIDTISGFNFEIDLADWEYKVIEEKDRFYIGIKMPDQTYHSFHGVHRSGNVGTLLYVPENPAGRYRESENHITIADLTEQFIKNMLTFDDVLALVKTKKITYAPDTSMQAMLSAPDGRVLIIEPGIGYWEERKRYSLITNYSLIVPEITQPFLIPGDDRFERVNRLLADSGPDFSAEAALVVLRSVCQEGLWGTRVSFVYSVSRKRVYYVLNNAFEHVMEYHFQ